MLSRTPRPGSRTPNSELSVLAVLHPPVLAHDHRGDRFAALNSRDVEALDAPREYRQAQNGLQRVQRFVLRGRSLVEAPLVGQLRVAVREIDEPALLAALGH